MRDHRLGGMVGGPQVMREGAEVFVPATTAHTQTDEGIIGALTRLAQALERQAEAIDTLAHVIASQYVEDDEGAEPARYLDGTPTLDG